MLTLIRREIEDNLIFFLAAIIVVVVFVCIVIGSSIVVFKFRPPIGVPRSMYGAFWWLLPSLAIASAALGAAQMYSDRSKKISTFLSTLSTTRSQILTARIIAGVLWILIILLPIAVADAILLQVFPRLAPVDMSFLIEVFAAAFLSALAGYAVGLQTGWNTNKFFPTLGCIAITPVLISVVLIKGFGVGTMVILLLLITATMVRTWQKFISTAL